MILTYRQYRITIGLILLLVVGLGLGAGCSSQKQETGPDKADTAAKSSAHETGKPDSEPMTLTITGNGVNNETKFTLTELQSMKEALAGECYSAVNNWPTKKFYVGKGVRISHLLEKAGIKKEAQTIIVRASDGYNAAFTREQLEEKRFCFPNLLKDSVQDAREVPAILAWEYREGTSDLGKAIPGNLCLLLGQKGLHDAVTPAYVRNVTTIEVLTVPPGQWGMVQADPAPGKVKEGTEVVLSHPEEDRVKIYYTIDGSTPDIESLIYNPSATYFQPDLIKPIRVNKDMVIKTIVIGFGKYDSQVATFEYDVE